ncbi:hypothetical protein LOY55_16395 [Pseudomonas sp. B21-040]|jgi:hypothetical protein|uniref:hypothetical protein n=1 Tax=unclassified Pseudomonas TaxID=196821 RepID=UPI000D6C101A|nr:MULTISPECIES: hypothetical protein [unclassified Pseudomonas]PWK35984.1 hypothetical protein C7534_11587 [Pseudomonas sp. OV226]UVL37851.1 hypothetical protein LOY55_16395 [Pseudomonas sp. B21-040]
MNRYVLGCTTLTLSCLLSSLANASPVQSSSLLLAQSPTGASSNPYNSPIRRANPNSMQGSQSSAPAIRGPNTMPVPRPPTLDNGGIGNRYPSTPSTPSSPPTFIPNPPPRDTGTSNR